MINDNNKVALPAFPEAFYQCRAQDRTLIEDAISEQVEERSPSSPGTISRAHIFSFTGRHSDPGWCISCGRRGMTTNGTAFAVIIKVFGFHLMRLISACCAPGHLIIKKVWGQPHFAML